jgi:hypothetical protein
MSKSQGCPDELRLARYVDGVLQPADQDAVKSHLLSCQDCLDAVGFLERTRSVPADQSVIARRPSHRTRPFSRWVWSSLAAVAAIAFIGVGVRYQLTQSAPVINESAPRIEQPLQRSSGKGHTLGIVSPEEGAAVSARALRIQWTTVPGAVDYEARIHNTAGSIIWRAQTAGTSVDATAAPLTAGQSYYTSVIARFEDGKTLPSPFARFAVTRP